jgi:transcriptional regulator with XRE-family HTH domain
MAKQVKNKDVSEFVDDPNDIVKRVAHRLQEARIRAGLTQTQLGERTGIKQSYIFELEFGNTNITLRTLEKMAGALDLDLRDLFPGPPGAPPSSADLKHVLLTLDRLTKIVEEQINQDRERLDYEKERTDREEQRRAKQDTVLSNALRDIGELRHQWSGGKLKVKDGK